VGYPDQQDDKDDKEYRDQKAQWEQELRVHVDKRDNREFKVLKDYVDLQVKQEMPGPQGIQEIQGLQVEQDLQEV
jgi:hypothetical protein